MQPPASVLPRLDAVVALIFLGVAPWANKKRRHRADERDSADLAVSLARRSVNLRAKRCDAFETRSRSRSRPASARARRSGLQTRPRARLTSLRRRDRVQTPARTMHRRCVQRPRGLPSRAAYFFLPGEPASGPCLANPPAAAAPVAADFAALSFFGFFASLWLRNCPLAITRLPRPPTADSPSIIDRKIYYSAFPCESPSTDDAGDLAGAVFRSMNSGASFLLS